MDNTAIKEIQETAIAASEVKDTFFAVKALPSNMTLHDLEPYQENRNRFRGRFSTSSLVDFVSYVKNRKGETCFIDIEKITAKTIFNLGDENKAGHADDDAILSLAKTSPYSELLQINGRSKSQRDLAEWVEDWRDHISVINDEGKDMTSVEAVAAIRRITIEAIRKQGNESRTFGESKSTLESIDAKSDAGSMPAWIVFTCKPYEDLPERDFHLRISITTTHEKPNLITRITKLELIQEEIASEFKGELSKKLDEDDSKVQLYLGAFTA